ncbi:nitric oxide synthase oxygenase [Actinocorallia lasiicapitis]
MLLFRSKKGVRVDEDSALEFIDEYYQEQGLGAPGGRLREVREEIRKTGTYRHTGEELEYGARVAWRNSSRCIGRLYWRSMRVRDRREVATAAGVAAESIAHLRAATNGGRIRPHITVFAPDSPEAPAPRIWNDQLIRYAGHTIGDGEIMGDPANAALTDVARSLGWRGGTGGPFDVLPLVIEAGHEPPELFELPRSAVREVLLRHPEHRWFAELGLRWHAVPAVSDMILEIGGISYPAAPFNGWYMGTEIGARNLADDTRYALLPILAGLLGLDTSHDASLWRDRALVELNRAVLHSFGEDGVTISDHHTESRRFLAHLEKEERAGRVCPADWSWIVPPMSSSATPVFHRYYENPELRPNFVRGPRPYG